MGRLVSELPLLLPPRTCQRKKERERKGKKKWNEKGKVDRKMEDRRGKMCVQNMIKANSKHGNKENERFKSKSNKQKKKKRVG